MPSLLRSLRLLGAVMLALAGCTSSTEPGFHGDLVFDPVLDLDAAHARWTALNVRSYTFEVQTEPSMLQSPGFLRIDVTEGRVTRARLADTGRAVEPFWALTIDELWTRLLSARARGEQMTQLRFSFEGIPIEAMVGSFANDSGVRYRVRSFAAHR